MADSLKTVFAGATGITVTWMEWITVAVRVLVGLESFVYRCVKIYKEIKR